MSDNQDMGQWPQGLAGFDRIWAGNPTGGIGVARSKEREAIAPFVRDDERVMGRHTVLRLYSNAGTMRILVAYLTNRQVIMLISRGSFRPKVIAEAFEYSRLLTTTDPSDEPLSDTTTVWTACMDFIDGERYVLNFYNSQGRDAFVDQFESLAKSFYSG